MVRGTPAPGSFASALAGKHLAVIAELKRQSPSKGVLDGSLSATDRPRIYVNAGAAALSILTEPDRFGGSLRDLVEARSAVAVPLLRKDFVTDEIQLLEARAYGASAALLIARALEPARLRDLAAAARALDLTALIEVRDESELAEAVDVAGAVIGVNNRNLETLVMEPEVGARLIPLVPADRVAVYESGIATEADASRAAALGADAVLVGSVLSTAADPAALVAAFSSPERRRRG
jgi:indole-3-glycerol phosphate synthase